jgi:hypothetical protein
MRVPTSRADALLAVAGVSVLGLQKAVTDSAAHEPLIHAVRDVADVIMKVGGAAAVVTAVVFWLAKKLLRPQLESMLRTWFAPDIRKFQRAIKRATDCADSLADHADNIAQADADLLLMLEAIAELHDETTEIFSIFDRILGIERRQGNDDRTRDLAVGLEVIRERRAQPMRRESDAHPGHATRIEMRRRERGKRKDDVDEIRRLGREHGTDKGEDS